MDDVRTNLYDSTYEHDSCGTARVAPFSQIEGSDKLIEADIVFLALGFVGPDPEFVGKFGLQTRQRSNVSANTTNLKQACPAYLQRATVDEANHWSSGRFAKAEMQRRLIVST